MIETMKRVCDDGGVGEFGASAAASVRRRKQAGWEVGLGKKRLNKRV